MSNRYKGGVISATPPTTTTSAASGVWSQESALQAIGATAWPRSPSAPTIGTATDTTTGGTVTVAFTAPSDTGSTSITSYTAVSTPGSLTGAGASSPVTVTGLTNGTSYTFKVSATNSAGTGPYSAASNSVTPTLVVNYYILSYANGPNVNGQYGSFGYDSTNNKVYMSGNLNNAICPQAYMWSRTGATSGTYEYNAQLQYSSGPITSPYFLLPQYSSGANRVYGFFQSVFSEYTRIAAVSTANPPTYIWGYQYVIFNGSKYNQLGTITSNFSLDSSGNLYVAGGLHSTDYICCSPFSIYDAYIFKLNSSGGVLWTFATTTGSYYTANISFRGIQTTAAGDSYAVGYVQSSSAVNVGAAVIKFNSSGTVQWQKLIRVSGNQTFSMTMNGGAITLDSSENVYIGGSFTGPFCLIKLDSSGNYQWSRTLTTGGGGNMSNPSLTTDSSGNVYAYGTGTGGFIHVLKYNSSGTLQWQRTWEASSSGSPSYYYYFSAGYGSIKIANDGSLLIGALGVSSTNYGFCTYFKLPADGSGIGTYSHLGASMYQYYAGSGTDSSLTVTVSNSSYTFTSSGVSNTLTYGGYSVGTTYTPTQYKTTV
jgi:hypothetical protein